MLPYGNTTQRASGDFARNLHASDTKQTLIFHKNAREYIEHSLRFLFHLTKNLTTHLSHNLCAVLPYIFSHGSAFPLRYCHYTVFFRFCQDKTAQN